MATQRKQAGTYDNGVGMRNSSTVQELKEGKLYTSLYSGSPTVYKGNF